MGQRHRRCRIRSLEWVGAVKIEFAVSSDTREFNSVGEYVSEDRVRFDDLRIDGQRVHADFVKLSRVNGQIRSEVLSNVEFHRCADGTYRTFDSRARSDGGESERCEFVGQKEVDVDLSALQLTRSVHSHNPVEVIGRLFGRTGLGSIVPSPADVSGIHYGDDVCEERFVRDHRSCAEAVRVSRDFGYRVTVSTPIVTSTRSSEMRLAIERIAKERPDSFVFNDWGTFLWLRDHTDAELVVGRWLFKMKKDPRYEALDGALVGMRLVSELESDIYRQFLTSNRVRQLQMDLPSYGVPPTRFENNNLSVSIRVPYSYVNYTRSCMIANHFRDSTRQFKVNETCKMQCGEWEADVQFMDRRTSEDTFATIDRHVPTVVRGRATVSTMERWISVANRFADRFDRVVYSPTRPE